VSDLKSVLDFVARLDEARLSYRILSIRPDALLVDVAVPGERWEIEFMVDGEVQIERFCSDGSIFTESVLPDLFALGE
jgi:hypothetical protein